jgi:type V secretory pathway adhesin AidA
MTPTHDIDNCRDDQFIKSISVLKQLFRQQKEDNQSTSMVEDREAAKDSIQLPSQNCPVASAGDEKPDSSYASTIAALQMKLENTEMALISERELRTSIEKAFDDLSVHRKLLQVQLDQLHQQQEASRAVEEELVKQKNYTENVNDENKEGGDGDNNKRSHELTILLDEEREAWNKERETLMTKLHNLQEQIMEQNSVQGNEVLETSENKTQSSNVGEIHFRIEALQQEKVVLQHKIEQVTKEHAASLLVTNDNKNELNTLQNERMTILQFLRRSRSMLQKVRHPGMC